MQNNDFVPDAMKTAKHSVTKDIKVDFLKDTGECVSIVLSQEKAISLLSELQRQIESKKIVPMHQDFLTPGTVHKIVSIQTKPIGNGDIQINFDIDFPERKIRSVLPVHVEKKDKDALIKDLSK